MQESNNVLISIQSQHLENIIALKKKVELRSRKVNISKGSIVWMYCILPVGEVRACAKVTDIITDTPKNIWKNYRDLVGIDKKSYDNYFQGKNLACAIFLKGIKELKNPVTLDTIRENVKNFHPPQFFNYLSDDSKLLSMLQKALR